ncbi:MAG: ABA4-like family protein [Myxococcaceae bacterium]|jgi:hypothetical protein|nr:ABA4-like family protein [Myxococcaceae bacterium]
MTLFAIAQVAPLPFWVALLFPTWRPARWFAFTPVFTLLGATAYGWALWQAPSGGSTFADLVQFFSSDWGALTVWLHAVVVDFLAGVWIAQDARRLGISRWASGPVLALTLFFAPLGLAGWFLVRTAWKGAWRLDG